MAKDYPMIRISPELKKKLNALKKRDKDLRNWTYNDILIEGIDLRSKFWKKKSRLTKLTDLEE